MESAACIFCKLPVGVCIYNCVQGPMYMMQCIQPIRAKAVHREMDQFESGF